MLRINPRQFFISWKKHTKNIDVELHANWKNPGGYTNLIQNNEGCILSGIANEFGFLYYREYYALDAVFYDKSIDKVTGLNDSWVWLRNIKIAFEHENDCTISYQEMAHLTVTNCELRVLVTYPWDQHEALLDRYTEIIQGNTTVKPDHSYLVIFGEQEHDNTVSWTAHVFVNGRWEELQEETL